MNIYDAAHERGGMTADYWDRDPKRLTFVLARYKFVAKMFEGKGRVLEVGCADGFGSRIVRQHISHLTAIDIDEKSIATANEKQSETWPIEFVVCDFMEALVEDNAYEAVYCLDVLEHIEPSDEGRFLARLARCAPVAIIGMPSLESQPYASELSRRGHVNCHSGSVLRQTLLGHWKQVFLFGMNDETLHTGFPPMSHYLLALAVA